MITSRKLEPGRKGTESQVAPPPVRSSSARLQTEGPILQPSEEQKPRRGEG